MHVVETIVPILGVIVLGYALTRGGFLVKPFVDGLTSLVYWVAIPALIIRSLLADSLDWSGFDRMGATLLLSTMAVLVLSVVGARMAGLAPATKASFIQGAFRGNLALIGFPMLIFIVGPERTDLLTAGVLLLAPSILFFNIVSVMTFSLTCPPSTTRSGRGSWIGALITLRTNPLILATLLAFTLSFLEWGPPVFVARFIDMLANIAGPLALICIGANIATSSFANHWKAPLFSSLLKVAVLPGTAWVLAIFFGLREYEMLIVLLYAACPTAAVSAILARQMGGDDSSASAIVALSTLVSVIPLSLIVWIYGGV